MSTNQLLPSAHQIGDLVNVSFGKSGELKDVEIEKVHFSESKITYDLSVPIEELIRYNPSTMEPFKRTMTTRIYNVDSAFVSKK